MKKILSLLILSLLSISLFAAGMSLTSSVQVDDVTLSWTAVPGAVNYDLYNGQEFLARVDSSTRSYSVSDLRQNEDYTFIIGARDGSNKALASARCRVRTGSYEGVYLWSNPTDDDNHGKVKELRVRCVLTEDEKYGQYMTIYSDTSVGEVVFFPLFPLDSDSWPWVETKSDSPIALVYNEMAGRFNTSIITPSRFRQDSVKIDNDYAEIQIRTKAFGIEVVTTTSFTFSSDSEGLYIDYRTDGNALVRSSIFKNPEGGDDPYSYRLRKID